MTRVETRACRRALGLLMTAALALGACARVRPLSGGPPDETPPVLLATSPPDSSLFLPRAPELRLHFDEKVSTVSLRRGLRTYPHLRVADVHADGNSALVTFVDSLPADTTWAVVLGRAVQDLPKRDNRLLREVWMLYSTGAAIRGAAVFGRIALHGKPETKGVVLYEPVLSDTVKADSAAAAALPRSIRPRYPRAATDDEGLFQLFGIPEQQPFRLIAFVDRNGDLALDDGELRTASPETLLLAVGEIRRGMQFDLIDPATPALVEGVVLNPTRLDAAIAVALSAIEDSTTADTMSVALGADRVAVDSLQTARLAVDDSTLNVDSVAVDRAQIRPRVTPPAAAAPDTVPDTPVAARADTVQPLRLPVADRANTPWGTAYERLEPEGFVRQQWRIVYASRRGDYSIEVPAGRHRLIAFVDVSADSAPGMYVGPDSTRLLWEPLWVGGVVNLAPGERFRPRAIEIEQAP